MYITEKSKIIPQCKKRKAKTSGNLLVLNTSVILNDFGDKIRAKTSFLVMNLEKFSIKRECEKVSAFTFLADSI